MKRTQWTLLAVFSLSSQLTFSDDMMLEEEMALSFEDEYVSIASGYEEVLSRAPAVASVITQKRIEAMGAKNLDDVLRSIPGMHIGISDHRFETIYSIRGIDTTTTDKALVLINSVPITQLFKGDRGWSADIPASTIKQVEVIRGPGSSVYGADAFSGVINVITKNGEDIDGLQVSGGAGSFDSSQASILFGKAYDTVDVVFAFDYYKTDGDEDRTVKKDRQTILDGNLGTNASLASGPNGPGAFQTQGEHFDIRVELSYDNWRVRAWNWIRRNMGLGPGEAQAIDSRGSFDTENYLVDLTYQPAPIRENMRFESTLSYMKVKSEAYLKLFPPGTRLPLDSDGNINRPPNVVGVVNFPAGFIGGPSYEEEHTRLDAHLFITDIGDHRIRIGAGGSSARLFNIQDHKNNGAGVLDQNTLNGDPLPSSVDHTYLTTVSGDDAFMAANKRDLFYLSMQDQWYLSPYWDLTAGLRYDNYSDFGSTTNPRVALVWHPSYDLTTKLLYGHAFRAPPFSRLYLQNNPIIRANPDLSPEKIKMYELSVNYQINFDLQTRVSAFHYKIEDFIENIPVEGQTGLLSPENIGSREADGIEWEVSWAATDNLNLSGHYSHHNARDTKNGGPVSIAPRNKLFLMAEWQAVDRWSVNGIFNWISDTKRVEDDLRDPIDDYFIADLVVQHRLTDYDVEFELLVKNVFDTEATAPSPYDNNTPEGAAIPEDYPLESRSFFLNVSSKF